MFTESEVRKYADECTALFADAAKRGGIARDAMPPRIALPQSTSMTQDWWKEIARSQPMRVRRGNWPGNYFIGDDGPEWKEPLKFGIEGNRVAGSIHLDRRAIPGSDRGNVGVVVEIPLRAPSAKLRIAPEGSPRGIRGQWLQRPTFITAPDGVRVSGLPRELTVRSPLVFSWALIPDKSDPNLTWLQGMIVRQTQFLQLKGGGTKVLPFEAWFPGEPAVIDVGVEMTMR
jgi:hypothetical protein